MKKVTTKIIFLLAALLCLNIGQVPSAFAQPICSTVLEQHELFDLKDSFSFPDKAAFSLSHQSALNLANYSRQLGPLSSQEEHLVSVIKKMPLTVSTRRFAADFIKIAPSGAILPREELNRLGISPTTQYKAKTEEDLFGASRWNFATISISGWDGIPMYGEVVSHIRKSAWEKNSWATPASGLKIYEEFRHIPRSQTSMQGIPSEYLESSQSIFKSKMITPTDYKNWIALDVISFIRGRSSAEKIEFFAADEKKTRRPFKSLQDGFP